MADAPANQPLSGQVPLYKKPEPLNKEKHRNLGMSPPKNAFAFLKDSHFLPAIVGEFTQYAGFFPVIFLGEKRLPVVVMGLNQGENLFIDADGNYEQDTMLPAFARRYPFVSASNGPDQPSTVCVDVEADGIGENGQLPFFDENGEPTEALQKAIEFVSAFDADARSTEMFVQRLIELDLFEPKDVTLKDNTTGESKKVAEYYGVAEQKLNALPTDVYLKLRDEGFLLAIYSHLISLNRCDRILNKAIRRQQAATSKAN